MDSQDKINTETNCLFCLELEANQISKLACTCRVFAHPKCWELYEEKKGFIECPICHCITEESPIQFAMKKNLQQSILTIRSHNDESDESFQKRCLCCCLGYFCLCGILSAVFG